MFDAGLASRIIVCLMREQVIGNSPRRTTITGAEQLRCITSAPVRKFGAILMLLANRLRQILWLVHVHGDIVVLAHSRVYTPLVAVAEGTSIGPTQFNEVTPDNWNIERSGFE